MRRGVSLATSDRVGLPGLAGWTLVACLAITHCLAFTDRNLMALLAPQVGHALDLSDARIGLLIGTAFALAYVGGSALLMRFAGWFRPVSMVIASLAISSLAMAGCGLARTFAEFFAARLLLGLGQAFLSPAALVLIAQAQPIGQLGRGVALYTAGGTLGRSLALLGGGGVLAAMVALRLDPAWRFVFLATIVPNLVMAALFLLCAPNRVSSDVSRSATPLPWLWRHRRFYLTHTLLSAATVLVIQTVTAWAVILLVRRFGLSVAAAGGIFGIVVLLAPAAHVGGGALLDHLAGNQMRHGPGLVMAIALLVAIAPAAVLALATSLPLAVSALAVLTIILGIASPAGFVGLQTETPQHLRAQVAAGFLVCITAVGFGLGPAVVGVLTDQILGHANVGLALLAVVIAAAAVGLLALTLQAMGGRHEPTVPAAAGRICRSP